jgi:hypothetical protein
MTRRLVVGLVAAAVLVLAAGALVVATRDGSEDEARMLVVPQVTGTGILRAYDLALAAGFRVAVSNGFSVAALCEPIAERQVPRSGVLLHESGVVTVDAGVCPLGSPAVRRPMPTATVPDFVGDPASAVVRWAETRGMFWWIRGASALTAGSTPHLLDNYRVLRQSPRPGARLRPGAFVRRRGLRGFRPTPITVWVGVA